MKTEIVKFLQYACRRLKLNANYIPDGDIWFVHKQGRAVQNFTTEHFYQLPKRVRMEHLEALTRVGLANNLNQANTNQFFLRGRKFGRKIA